MGGKVAEGEKKDENGLLPKIKVAADAGTNEAGEK